MWGVGRKEQWQVEKYALIRVDDGVVHFLEEQQDIAPLQLTAPTTWPSASMPST
jgi:hypothetical protein